MIAYLITTSKKRKSEEDHVLLMEEKVENKRWLTTNYKNGMTLLMIIMPFIPIEIPFLREIQTILTALLMCLPPPPPSDNDNHHPHHHSSSLIESKIMNSFGNISYSLYLIHWPIYAFWKLNLSNGDIYNWNLFIALFISITLSILSYEFFEKVWTQKNGKYRFMLIGNSYSLNHATLFHQECGHKANSIALETMPTCEPLYPPSEREGCSERLRTFEREVEEIKPDYLFIFSRFFDIGNPMPPNVTSLDEDPIYRKMKSQLEIYLKSVRNKIYMMNQIARSNKQIGLIAKAVVEKQDLVELDKSLVARDPKMARLRYEKLVSECSRCALIDYKPYFFNETTQTWRFYDEQQAGLTYLTNGIHLSFHGLELIRPVIRNVCNSL
uniref:Ovule protein n=2 Tax=Caenorhabditis tropicalis TaxID=1561998 RepID=A0A1I7UEC1_9PELO